MISFLQSKEWADFQKSLGRKIWQIDGVLIIKHNLPFGKSYLYAPRLCLDFGGQARFEEILEKIRRIAKQENAIFLKIEPLDFARGNSIELGKFGFKKSHNIQPTKTIILDITKSEKELLSQMHYKTRYNIKLAEKRVKIQISSCIREARNSKLQTLNTFWKLLKDTAKKGKFRTHPEEYYKKMLEVPGAELFVALIPISSGRATPKVVAANIVLFWDKIATYLHGASDYKYRNLMAPFLLQWEQIKEAKKRGCIEYDFWGIDEKKWPGITRFKRGFGGREVNYAGAYDLVFQPIWYRIYKAARLLLTGSK